MRVIFVPPANHRPADQQAATDHTRRLAQECGPHTVVAWNSVVESFTPSVHRFLVNNHDPHKDLSPLFASAIARRMFSPLPEGADKSSSVLLVLGFPKFARDLETLFQCIPEYTTHDVQIALARWPQVALAPDCELNEFFDALWPMSASFSAFKWACWRDVCSQWQRHSGWRQYMNPLLSYTEGVRRCDALEEAAVVQWTIEWTESKRVERQFCGTHPVLLSNESIEQLLMCKDYAVSEKIDGERFFLVLSEQNKAYFVDRSTRVHVRHLPECVHGQWDGTLLDCEMVRTGPYESNVEIVILDVLTYQRRSCCNLPLYDRLAFASSFITAIAKCNVDESGKRVWWNVRLQTYVHLQRGPAVRQCFLSKVEQRDGFVFTPERGHYRLGTDSQLLKFQERSRISVDFCFHRPNLLYVGGERGETPFKGATCNNVPASVRDGAIIECVIDPSVPLSDSHTAWSFLRERKDKRSPNIWWAAQNNLKTIKQNISFDRLMQMLGEPAAHTPMPPRPVAPEHSQPPSVPSKRMHPERQQMIDQETVPAPVAKRARSKAKNKQPLRTKTLDFV